MALTDGKADGIVRTLRAPRVRTIARYQRIDDRSLMLIRRPSRIALVALVATLSMLGGGSAHAGKPRGRRAPDGAAGVPKAAPSPPDAGSAGTSDGPSPLARRFVQVATGAHHVCAIKVGGRVVCWGSDGNRQSSPTASSFTQLSAGAEHTCGVMTDGAIGCCLILALDRGVYQLMSAWLAPAPTSPPGTTVFATYLRTVSPAGPQTLRSRAVTLGGREEQSAPRSLAAP